jgi:hypothetical protein
VDRFTDPKAAKMDAAERVKPVSPGGRGIAAKVAPLLGGYRTGLVSDASSSPSSHRTTSPGEIGTAPGVPVDRMSPG